MVSVTSGDIRPGERRPDLLHTEFSHTSAYFYGVQVTLYLPCCLIVDVV